MKRLLAYLFIVLGLTFNFQSLTKADDIRDFEIEGISIGDSLLNFMTESEIIFDSHTANFDEGSVVGAEELLAKKLISEIPYHGVWVVGGGKCGKLTIKANKFSSRVQQELKRAGGTAEVISETYGSLDF